MQEHNNNHTDIALYQSPENRIAEIVIQIPLLAENPVTLTTEEQMELCRATPDPTTLKHHPMGYYYLGIEYIRDKLDQIFGTGNWATVSLPNYPQWRESEIKTRKDEPYKICTDAVWIVVRWASGKTQRCYGTGEHEWFYTSPNAGRSATEEAAHSQATKAAVKKLGPAFGQTLSMDVEEGLPEKILVSQDLEFIHSTVGTRLFYSTSEQKDIILTEEAIDKLSIYYVGVGLKEAESSAKAVRALAQELRKTPTPIDKAILIAEARRLGLNDIIQNMSGYAEIRKAVDKHYEDHSAL